MLKKKENWERNLYRAAEGLIGQPFEYGRMDCVLLTCLCIDAMCDSRLYEKYRGNWNSVLTAWRWSRKNYDLEQFLSIYAFRVKPKKIRTGDIFIDALASSICIDNKWFTASASFGVGYLGISNLLVNDMSIWRIN